MQRYKDALREFQTKYWTEALAETRGNIKEAAYLAGTDYAYLPTRCSDYRNASINSASNTPVR